MASQESCAGGTAQLVGEIGASLVDVDAEPTHEEIQFRPYRLALDKHSGDLLTEAIAVVRPEKLRGVRLDVRKGFSNSDAGGQLHRGSVVDRRRRRAQHHRRVKPQPRGRLPMTPTAATASRLLLGEYQSSITGAGAAELTCHGVRRRYRLVSHNIGEPYGTAPPGPETAPRPGVGWLARWPYSSQPSPADRGEALFEPLPLGN